MANNWNWLQFSFISLTSVISASVKIVIWFDQISPVWNVPQDADVILILTSTLNKLLQLVLPLYDAHQKKYQVHSTSLMKCIRGLHTCECQRIVIILWCFRYPLLDDNKRLDYSSKLSRVLSETSYLEPAKWFPLVF